jgi:perosamine synthetase
VSSAGPDISRFEAAVAGIVGARHAVATASGTAAIHLGLLCAGVRPGDLVAVPTLTFIGTVNAITFCGASPLLIDSIAVDGTLDATALRRYLERDAVREKGETRDRATGRRIGAMLPVHLFGLAPDLDECARISESYGIALVEDAAEAFGSRVHGRGAGTLGVVGCVSFNGNKIVTSGGGGMVVTDREDIAARARYLSTQARDDKDEFVHHEIGFNYRLTNLQAALGIGQLEDFSDRLARKRAYAALYRRHLRGVPLHFLEARPGNESNYWLTAVVFDDSEARPRVLAHLAASGIEARSFFQPMHWQRPYREAPRVGSMLVADDLYRRGVNLPSSVDLEDADIERISATVCEALARVS